MRLKRKRKMVFPRTMFECKVCGKCCVEDVKRGRRIVLTEIDALEISSATGIGLNEFAEKNSSEAYPYAIRLVNGRCFFLNQDNKCSIYPVRPLVCRFYPFVMHKIGETYVFHADPFCPGLGEGTYLDEEYFERLVELAEKRLKKPTGLFEARRS
jgi:Fe-S-cluster containining protein